MEAADLSVLSPAEVTAALRDVAVIRGTTDRLEAVLVRRVAELYEAGSAAPPADVLGRGGRMSRRAAEQVDRRAGALGRTPKLNDALGKGRVGAEHADAVAAAAGRLNDAQREVLFEKDREITELAVSQPPEVFRRGLGKLVDDITADDGLERAARQEAAATASMKFDDDTSMHLLFAKLTPEQGNRMRRALDHEVAAIGKLSEFGGLRRDQLMVRALDRLVSGEASIGRNRPRHIHAGLFNSALDAKRLSAPVEHLRHKRQATECTVGIERRKDLLSRAHHHPVPSKKLVTFHWPFPQHTS